MSNHYIDEYLFQNHPWETPDSEYVTAMVGGGDDSIENVPNGGFPPLYPVKTSVKEDEDTKQVKREYVGRKSAVSVKSIMERRRHATPFIPVGTAHSKENGQSTEESDRMSTVGLSDIKYNGW